MVRMAMVGNDTNGDGDACSETAMILETTILETTMLETTMLEATMLETTTMLRDAPGGGYPESALLLGDGEL
ncbi:uncharacterized protein PgNI_08271 [Pyricularia grisea]|uniref:Uncharacterized protein n=1 Tax=Pyricularia grisea TaxID=148305 RepID=A0A6P8AVS5_PYRGI|nr:uncharacterized protein PgNI_08271 [Pyricularia grisea]TLD06297.1 hypothetical protein PgNI_08271 [Pyricularia grisea]